MNDIRALIDSRPISGLQYTVIALCFLMNILDGMDVLVISYAAQALATEWAISPEALGVVFSAGLFGMTAGALLLAPIADYLGRRTLILLCLVIMASGVLLTAHAQNITQLTVLRFASGLGIGAMLASAATMTAEYAPDRRKNFLVSAVLAGYPVGATLSGVVAASVIPEFGWRTMFTAAGLATALAFPLVYFLLPESLNFLVKVRRTNALEKINSILRSMGGAEFSVLPPTAPPAAHSKVSSLFAAGKSAPTLWLWLAFFMSFATLYFLLSWIPLLAANTGLSQSLAIYAGAIFNLGAFFGILLQGYSSELLGLRRAIGVFLVASAGLMTVFGYISGSAAVLVLFGLIGFALQGGFTGLYSVAARLYPTEVRTMGVGWAIGVGRTGAIVGPAAGGLLIGMGLSMSANFIVFAVPVVVAAVATALIR
ncbi:MAG: MFS transporter, partial [Gammaproteobacteria bacterium]